MAVIGLSSTKCSSKLLRKGAGVEQVEESNCDKSGNILHFPYCQQIP